MRHGSLRHSFLVVVVDLLLITLVPAMISSRAQLVCLFLLPVSLALFLLASVGPDSAFCLSVCLGLVLCHHLERGLPTAGNVALAWLERGFGQELVYNVSKTLESLPWLRMQEAQAGKAGLSAQGNGALLSRKGSTLQLLG